jgi:enolase
MTLFTSAKPLLIYTSTSRPTVELTVRTASGCFGRASLPLGYEDCLPQLSHPPMHQLVLEVIETLIPRVILDLEFVDQSTFDRDVKEATQDLPSGFRAKVRYLISAACAKARSSDQGILLHEYLAAMAGFDAYRGLPVPMITLLCGGKVATTPFGVQAIMVVPTGISPFPDAVRAGSEISDALSQILRDQEKLYAIGDEGGFSTNFDGDSTKRILCHALETVISAIAKAGYEPHTQIRIAIDFAAEHCKVGKDQYALVTKDEPLSASGVVDLYEFLVDEFRILVIEDPLAISDLGEIERLHKGLQGRSMVAADDLLGDSLSPVAEGNPWDAVVTMPDRLGTLSDTLEFVASARAKGYIPIASHRSGETEDVLLSDLAAALSLPFIKAGGMSGSERTGKYNQLLRISELYDNNSNILKGCLGGNGKVSD